MSLSSRCPDKYDTYIEQGGTNVSGGQKQRLCIARALLKKPKILILDDSTSAVDTKTDAKIRAALRTEIPETTKFIIAQRISSIQDADLILVLGRRLQSTAWARMRHFFPRTRSIRKSIIPRTEREVRTMANHPGRAPRAPMVGAKADLKPLGRVIRMLFQDYPAMLIAVMVCIIISAIVGILPAIYIETITSYIEDGLRLGWDGVSGKILHALVTMVCIYLVGLACTAVYTQLMAHVTQGFLHKHPRPACLPACRSCPSATLTRTARGDIMSYYTNDTDTLRQLISQSLPQLFAAGLTVSSACCCIMLYYSMPLMLIVVPRHLLHDAV